MMTTYPRSQRASYNEVIIKKVTSCGSMINPIYGMCIYDLEWNASISLLFS